MLLRQEGKVRLKLSLQLSIGDGIAKCYIRFFPTPEHTRQCRHADAGIGAEEANNAFRDIGWRTQAAIIFGRLLGISLLISLLLADTTISRKCEITRPDRVTSFQLTRTSKTTAEQF